MIVGIGTDIVKIERIARILDTQPHFIKRVFTIAEAEYCYSKARPAESFAVRFAAKEAFMKAMGTGWGDGVNWQDIEVINDPLGKPTIVVHNATKVHLLSHMIDSIHLSLAHEKEYGIAYVVLERH